MVSVHGMSSAKMGLKNEKNTVFNLNGRSFDFKNLFCLDSSILPSSTIESPQRYNNGSCLSNIRKIFN